MSNNRIYYLDILRIIAIAMVVMIHASGWFSFPPASLSDAWDPALFGAFSACAVPLFFMISGALLLSPNYEYSIRKVLIKVFKIVVIWILWSAIYAAINMDHFSLKKLVIWTVKGPFHFWFFEYLIGVYLLSPVLRALTEYKDGQYVRYFLICWLLLGIVKYSLNGIPWYSDEIRVFTGKIHFELCDFSGYFVLGHYLAELRGRRIDPGLWLVLFIMAGIAQFAISRYYPLNVGTYSFTLLVLLEAICMFMFCKRQKFNVNNPCLPVLEKLSLASLGIFIIHPIILEHWIPFFIWTLPPVIRVLTLWGYVFLLACIITMVLLQIPFCKKWMLKV